MSWFKNARKIEPKKRIYYEVHLRWESNPYIERVDTNSYTAAKNAIKARFPGAYIGKIVRKKTIIRKD